jgi:hypothetical protein
VGARGRHGDARGDHARRRVTPFVLSSACWCRVFFFEKFEKLHTHASCRHKFARARAADARV